MRIQPNDLPRNIRRFLQKEWNVVVGCHVKVVDLRDAAVVYAGTAHGDVGPHASLICLSPQTS